MIAIPSHAEASSELCRHGVRVSPGRHRAQLSSPLWHPTAEMWVGAILNIYVFLGAIREIIWRCAACFPNLDNSKRCSKLIARYDGRERFRTTLINIFVRYSVCSFRLLIEYLTSHLTWLVTWIFQVNRQCNALMTSWQKLESVPQTCKRCWTMSSIESDLF